MSDYLPRLLNMLAVVHRDGGHYVTDHGLAKACVDGEARVLAAHHAADCRAEAEAEAARVLDAIIEVGEALECAVGATPTEILARAKRYAGIVGAAKELVFCDYLTECESYDETALGSHQAAACRAGDAQGVLSRLIDELQESETNPTTVETP